MNTLFTYGVNLDFSPTAEEEEAGVTVFLTQVFVLAARIIDAPACAECWNPHRTITLTLAWSLCH